MHKIIANTTPIIALAEINQLDLLEKLYGTILIPQAVYDEIKTEHIRNQVQNASWIQIKAVSDNSQRDIFNARLHAGEVEVIILSKEIGADLAIIDDNTAKKTAKYLEIPVTGTLGVLLRAKREGYIDRVSPLLEELVLNGFYISDEIRKYALEAAKELVE